MIGSVFFFFFNDTATTEIYTLSLHDALPISHLGGSRGARADRSGGGGARPRLRRDHVGEPGRPRRRRRRPLGGDRKSTRLNSSHGYISYAVFCLKKKNPYEYKQEHHHYQHQL